MDLHKQFNRLHILYALLCVPFFASAYICEMFMSSTHLYVLAGPNFPLLQYFQSFPVEIFICLSNLRKSSVFAYYLNWIYSVCLRVALSAGFGACPFQSTFSLEVDLALPQGMSS